MGIYPFRFLILTALAGAMAGVTVVAHAEDMSIYQRNCGSCHDTGVGGAPKTGDVTAWKERIAMGADNLMRSVIDGMQGYSGVMPPRGGNPKLTDAEIRAAVEFIILRSR